MYEDLTSDPRHPCKMRGSAALGRWRQPCGPASLAESVNFRFIERPVSKAKEKAGEMVWRVTAPTRESDDLN